MPIIPEPERQEGQKLKVILRSHSEVLASLAYLRICLKDRRKKLENKLCVRVHVRACV